MSLAHFSSLSQSQTGREKNRLISQTNTTMSKLFTILTIVLLLSFGLIQASRPNVGLFTTHSSDQLHEDAAVEMKSTEVEDENCDEFTVEAGKEECLMRRTLAAHVDYIYTQKHKPKN